MLPNNQCQNSLFKLKNALSTLADRLSNLDFSLNSSIIRLNNADIVCYLLMNIFWKMVPIRYATLVKNSILHVSHQLRHSRYSLRLNNKTGDDWKNNSIAENNHGRETLFSSNFTDGSKLNNLTQKKEQIKNKKKLISFRKTIRTPLFIFIVVDSLWRYKQLIILTCLRSSAGLITLGG